jgi:hypothetical protein
LHFSGEEMRRELRERHGRASDAGCFQELSAGEM